MLRLILVRHAKSAWTDVSLIDFDRPLAPRGRRAALWIGQTVAERGWSPSRIVCSPAARTRETLDLSAMGQGCEVIYDPEVYERRDWDYLDLIRTQGGASPVLMIVGHNSATDTTASLLAEDGTDLGGFATGAIAVFDLDIAAWAELAEGAGRIVAYLQPPKK